MIMQVSNGRVVTPAVTLLVVVGCLISLSGFVSLCLAADKDQPAAVITTPKEDGAVEQVDDVEGKCNIKGWPVVLVRPMVGDQPWWVQELPAELNDGRFTTRANFGDADTKAGTRFRIVILIAESRDLARKQFTPGAQFRTLPQLPRSEPVNVKRAG